MEGWMDGGMDGWMEGWMDDKIIFEVSSPSKELFAGGSLIKVFTFSFLTLDLAHTRSIIENIDILSIHLSIDLYMYIDR